MNAGRVATSNGGLLVGVDIGGTKTAILIAEPDGIVVGHHLAPTAVGAPERAADAIAGLVVTTLADAGAAPQDVAALGGRGPASVARAMAGWAKSDDFPERRNLRPIGADAVFAAAGVGDPVAIQVIEDTGRAIAWGVHLLALAYNVEILVLGGGVSHAGEPFMAPIRRELDRYRGSSQLAKEVLVPDLVQLLPPGADAGAWGALTIAREALSAAPVAARREVGHA